MRIAALCLLLALSGCERSEGIEFHLNPNYSGDGEGHHIELSGTLSGTRREVLQKAIRALQSQLDSEPSLEKK